MSKTITEWAGEGEGKYDRLRSTKREADAKETPRG